MKIMKKNRRKIVISRYGRKNKEKQHTERKRKNLLPRHNTFLLFTNEIS